MPQSREPGGRDRGSRTQRVSHAIAHRVGDRTTAEACAAARVLGHQNQPPHSHIPPTCGKQCDIDCAAAHPSRWHETTDSRPYMPFHSKVSTLTEVGAAKEYENLPPPVGLPRPRLSEVRAERCGHPEELNDTFGGGHGQGTRTRKKRFDLICPKNSRLDTVCSHLRLPVAKSL